MTQLYYTPPEEILFIEVKAAAMEIWKGYDDTYGYASGKIDRIKHMPNVSDNFMYMVAMFDEQNQTQLSAMIGATARKAILERIIDGGGDLSYSPF